MQRLRERGEVEAEVRVEEGRRRVRRRDPVLDEQLRTYLFTSGSILEVESEAQGDDAGDDQGDGAAARESAASDGSLAIGSLRGDANL